MERRRLACKACFSTLIDFAIVTFLSRFALTAGGPPALHLTC
jgi:hypothetical protein